MNIKNIYILTLTICLLLLGVQASAQEPKDFTYSHIGLSEGVSNQRIYSIRQTADGALWWSSKEGVERYNGVVIKHYKSGGQSFSGSAGRITKLTLGCDSSLIAFDNKGGIYVYDEVQDRFNPYADISELIEGDVLLSDVYPAEKGMWLAMREGVFFLQPDKVLTAVVRDVYANAIVAVDAGLLLCTRTGVLSYAMSEGDVPKENMRLPQLTDYNVESGYYDPIYKKVWLGGFMNGLHILSAGADGVLHEQALSGETIFNPVRSICPYDEKTMLVGIDGQGVFKVSRQLAEDGRHTVSLLFDANEGAQGVLHGNGIYAMLRDLWGNIVIGTYSGGIDMIRPVGSTPAIFQHIRDNQQTLLNDHVNCVNQWTSGMLMMGTDNGVSLYHPQTQRWVHTCQGVVVLSLCQTPQGTMLASTYGKGVYEISENGEARQIYTKSNGVLKDDHVYKLLYDRQGSLWMGCLDGDLVQIPAGSRGAEGCRYYPINNVQDMVQLPDSRIAVGTANGLWLIDPLTGEVSELDYSSAHPGCQLY